MVVQVQTYRAPSEIKINNSYLLTSLGLFIETTVTELSLI